MNQPCKSFLKQVVLALNKYQDHVPKTLIQHKAYQDIDKIIGYIARIACYDIVPFHTPHHIWDMQKKYYQHQLTQPEITQQEITQQEITQQELTQQEITQQELTQPELTQQEITQPDVVTQQELTQQELTQQELTQQELTQQEITYLTQPDVVTQQEITYLTQPDVVTQQELTQQEITQQELTYLTLQDGTRTEITYLTQPDVVMQQEITQQDGTLPDGTLQDANTVQDNSTTINAFAKLKYTSARKHLLPLFMDKNDIQIVHQKCIKPFYQLLEKTTQNHKAITTLIRYFCKLNITWGHKNGLQIKQIQKKIMDILNHIKEWLRKMKNKWQQRNKTTSTPIINALQTIMEQLEQLQTCAQEDALRYSRHINNTEDESTTSNLTQQDQQLATEQLDMHQLIHTSPPTSPDILQHRHDDKVYKQESLQQIAMLYSQEDSDNQTFYSKRTFNHLEISEEYQFQQFTQNTNNKRKKTDYNSQIGNILLHNN